MFSKKVSQKDAIDAIVKTLVALGDKDAPKRSRNKILHDCVVMQAHVGFVPLLNNCKAKMSGKGFFRRNWEIEGASQESVNNLIA